MKVAKEKKYIKGTRVPFHIFLDYIKNGLSINDFLSSYYWVSKKEILKEIDRVKKERASDTYASA